MKVKKLEITFENGEFISLNNIKNIDSVIKRLEKIRKYNNSKNPISSYLKTEEDEQQEKKDDEDFFNYINKEDYEEKKIEEDLNILKNKDIIYFEEED